MFVPQVAPMTNDDPVGQYEFHNEMSGQNFVTFVPQRILEECRKSALSIAFEDILESLYLIQFLLHFEYFRSTL